MTLSTVGDRREKLRWLWRSDTLTRHLASSVWWSYSMVYMASSDLWSAMYFTVVCTSALQFTVRGDTFTCDIPRTFWRELGNEPKMSRFRHQQSEKILHNKILQIYATPLNIQWFPVVTVVLIYQWVLLATYPPLSQHPANQTRKTSESMIYLCIVNWLLRSPVLRPHM